MSAAAAASNEVDNNTLALNFELLLAAKVRQHPILYDRNHRLDSCTPANSNAQQHREVWASISEELNLEVDSCIALWACVKQKYIKNRKRISNGEHLKFWPLYDTLHSWLDKHIKKRRSRSDICKRIRSTHPNSTVSSSSVTGFNPMKKNMMEIELDYTDSIDSAEWCEIPEDTEEVNKLSDPVASVKSGKRRATGCPATIVPKRKVKVELLNDAEANESDSGDIFTELDEPKPLPPKPVTKLVKSRVVVENFPKPVVRNVTTEHRVPTKTPTVPAKPKAPTMIAEPQPPVAVPVKTTSSPLLPKINRVDATSITKTATEPPTEPKVVKPLETPVPKPIEPATISSERPTSSGLSDGIGKLENVIERSLLLVEKYITQAKPDSNEVFGKFVASMVRELPTEKRMVARVEILQFVGELINRLNGDGE